MKEHQLVSNIHNSTYVQKSNVGCLMSNVYSRMSLEEVFFLCRRPDKTSKSKKSEKCFLGAFLD